MRNATTPTLPKSRSVFRGLLNLRLVPRSLVRKLKADFVLVVDHPARDLPGLVLLASELASRGHTVLLVATRNSTRWCFRLAGSTILLNYLRQSNEVLIRTLCQQRNKLAVLDTEGFFPEGPSPLTQGESQAWKMISRYYVWSTDSLEVLRLLKPDFTDFRLTGQPRFDVPVILGGLQKQAVAEEPHSLRILILTSSPIPFPRYQSKEQEEHQLTELGTWRKQRFLKIRDSQERLRQEVLSILDGALKATNAEISIRPHPFEDWSYFEELAKSNSRLSISVGSSIYSDLLNADVVVVPQSSTSFLDSALMGKRVLLYGEQSSPLSDALSEALARQSPVDLEDTLGDFGTSHQILSARGFAQGRNNQVEKMVGLLDGACYKRLAEELLELHRERFPAPNQTKKHRFLTLGQYLRIFIGLPTKGVRADRGFTEREVSSICDLIGTTKRPDGTVRGCAVRFSQ